MELIKKGRTLCGAVESRPGGRDENQDNYITAESRIGFFVAVCDGMGGGPGGRTASTIACNVLKEGIRKATPDQPVSTVLASLMAEANKSVYEAAGANKKLHGMGTTCVCALITDTKVTVAHVGDSRCVLIRNGRMVWRTADHSYVDELVRRGSISPEQARQSSFSNIVTRVLGIKPTVEIEIDELNLKPGDRLALMSDGIWGMLPDDILSKTLSARSGLAEIVGSIEDNIDDLGHDNGGKHDNMTLLLLELPSSISEKPKEAPYIGKGLPGQISIPLKKRHRSTLNIVMIVILSVLLAISVTFNVYFFHILHVAPAFNQDTESIIGDEKTSLTDNSSQVSKTSEEKNFMPIVNLNKAPSQSVEKITKDPLREEASDSLIGEAIKILDHLKKYGHDGRKKLNKENHRERIQERRNLRHDIIKNLDNALRQENGPAKRKGIEDVRNEIKTTDAICTGIDKKWGHSTKETENKINEFISKLDTLKSRDHL